MPLGVVGCRCAREAGELEELIVEERKPEVEEPPPEKIVGERWCAPVPGFRPEVLRSSARSPIDEELTESPYGLEVGVASFATDGIWLPLLRTGPRSELALLRFERPGGGRSEVPLGGAYGDVGPPRLAVGADRVLGVEFESAARGRNLKVFSVELGAAGFEVVWGPEVAHESLTEDSTTLGLARDGRSGLLVRETRDGRFESLRWSFAGPGVAAARRAFERARPTPLLLRLPNAPGLGTSVSLPAITSLARGFALTFLRSVARDESTPEAPDFVGAETFGVPYLALLDSEGLLESAPVPLLATPRAVLRVTVGERGDELEALVQTPSGADAPAFEVATVRRDGTVTRRPLAHESAHGAENVLFVPGEAAGSGAWFLGGGDRPLLVEGARGAPLFRELGMEPGDPLGSGVGEVLTVTPRGLDLEMGLYRCAPAPP